MIDDKVFNKYFELLSDKNKDMLINYLTCCSLYYPNFELDVNKYLTFDSIESRRKAMHCCWIMVGDCWCGDVVILDTGEIAVFYENKYDQMLYKATGYEKEVFDEMLSIAEENILDCDSKREKSKIIDYLERI